MGGTWYASSYSFLPFLTPFCDVTATSDISTRPQSPEPASSPPPHLAPVPTQQPEISPSSSSANDKVTPVTKKTRSRTTRTNKATMGVVGGDAEPEVEPSGRGQRKKHK